MWRARCSSCARRGPTSPSAGRDGAEAKRNFSSIFLEPLSHDDAATLVEVLLAVEELPDETREAMLARADGNPLFLEEIIRQLIDEGRIVRDGGRWRATEGIDEIVIPDTVQAVLAARIDLLPAVERSALLSASVVGRVFWSGSVAQLLDDGNELADDALGRLEDRELVLSQLGSRIAGEREFLFKHVLTRDVAYGTLARRDRARAHADVAAWIESAAGERQPEFADLLAHHLGLAYEGALADPGVSADRRDELRRRSLHAALAASAEARSRMLLDKANAFAEAALGVAADAHERSLALEALGLCALWHYRGDDAWRNLSQAVDERLAAGRASGEDLAMLCARAVESPTRWPASMAEQPEEAAVARYVEIGLEHAASDGEARVRLLLARGMWVFAFRRDRVHRRGRRDRAPGERRGIRPRGSARTRRPRKRSARRRDERRVHRRPARADVARGGAQARDRRATHGSLGSRRRVPDSGRHRARDRPLRRRAALGERGVRARPRRAGRLAGRAGVAGDRSLQARRLGRSHRGLRAHGGRACDDAVRNRRVLHAHDVELHRAALRASWRTSCSGQAGRRHGPGAPRYGDDPEDPVAREAVGAPRVGRGARANRGERVDCSAGRWPRARSWRRSAT